MRSQAVARAQDDRNEIPQLGDEDDRRRPVFSSADALAAMRLKSSLRASLAGGRHRARHHARSQLIDNHGGVGEAGDKIDRVGLLMILPGFEAAAQLAEPGEAHAALWVAQPMRRHEAGDELAGVSLPSQDTP